jgi:DNA-directed RNA polymerase subunit RPC12/RpoP
MTDCADKPIATLSWSLDVDCPKCGGGNDLSSSKHDSEYQIAKHVFNNDWKKLEGFEVTCQHCGHEFTIDRVEY